MSERPDRLFGTVGAEVLYRTIAEVYENVIEDRYEPGQTVEIEEWTVSDSLVHFPTGEQVADSLLHNELASAEVTEDWWDSANDNLDAEVTEALDKAVRLWASKVTYWMADRHIASHSLVTGDTPTINGEPLYQRVSE